MSDVESSEAPPSLLPQFSADVSTSDDDKALHAIWEKNNSPMEELRNPAMPETFAAAEGDHFQASWEWNQLPLGRSAGCCVRASRQCRHKETGRRHSVSRSRAWRTSRPPGSCLPAKISSSSPRSTGKRKPASTCTKQSSRVPKITARRASISPAWSSMCSAIPSVAAGPCWRAWVYQSPLALLTPQEWQQAREHLMGTQPQQPQQSPEDGIVAAWAGERGLSMEDRLAMAEIISGPTWREIAGESDQSTLDRAYKALQRSQSRNGNSNRRVNAALDRTLRGMV